MNREKNPFFLEFEKLGLVFVCRVKNFFPDLKNQGRSAEGKQTIFFP